MAEWASRRFNLVGDRADLRATRIEGAFGTVLGWRKRLEGVNLGPVSEVALGEVAPGGKRPRAGLPSWQVPACNF